SLSAQSEVRDQLRLVNRSDPFNRFELDHDLTLDDEIHAVATVQRDALVLKRKCDLFLEVDLAKVKLVRQALFVSGLQEPWTESSMDLDRCADDVFGDLLVMKHSVSPNVGCTEVYHPDKTN